MKKKIEASDLQSKMTLQNYGIKTVCASNKSILIHNGAGHQVQILNQTFIVKRLNNLNQGSHFVNNSNGRNVFS